MKVLIITTYFAPDTAMAAVRPYMFAKYLSLAGHDVTVVRSGEILQFIDENFNCEQYGVRVISYLGENSEAELFKKGKLSDKHIIGNKSRISFLPVKIRKTISKLYHSVFKVFEYKKEEKKSLNYLRSIEATLNELKNENFDIVFSTYGRLDNVFAGKVASDILNCPWILDLRDRIAHDKGLIVGAMQRKIEKKYCSLADSCVTVSKSYYEDIKRKYKDANPNLIYNGYEKRDECVTISEKNKRLVFCYTGSMYTGALTVDKLFKALSFLSSRKEINLDDIEFLYAGKEFEYIINQAEKHNVQSIMKDMGYLNREQIYNLQTSSDVYVVAARNIKHHFDEIPGKIYEGIRANRPILTLVAGNAQNGELKYLDDKFHYGYCYEEGGGQASFDGLCDYLVKLYNTSSITRLVPFNSGDELKNYFEYSQLTSQVEKLMINTIERWKHNAGK